MPGRGRVAESLLRLAAIPWRRLKWQRIRRTLADRELLRCFAEKRPLPPGYGRLLDERIVEYPAVLSRLAQLPPGRIFDAGSALNFAPILEHPLLSRHHLTIMTLAPEKNCFHDKNVDYVYGDLRHTLFRDESFDAVVSISTLEHIGLDTTPYGVEADKLAPDDYLDAVGELARVLKPGGKCLITVPAGKRAILGFMQILDQAQIEALIHRFRPTAAETIYYRHLPSGWAQCAGFEEVRDAGYSSYLVQERFVPRRPGAEAVAVIALQK
ncbi:MAG: class I SAM-dependent methyltransferase [Myxococcales bacterium]